ncbi:hypothetical protein ABZ876_08190 [Streptomyces sp. NPDC046931]|uniref:hypothetical protein n=1 Tax=Streptomyces sp. NPDC046931 TaxID=3154806 RepID=UPI0033F642F8
MTDKPQATMTPDELALELFTTGQSITGGRKEAERLLRQIKARHAHQLAETIRTTDLPEIHVDMFDNGTQWAANLIDPEATR